MKREFTYELHLRNCKHINANKSNFRIVEISNCVFRIEYKILPFVWDKKLKQIRIWGCAEDGHSNGYIELLFNDVNLAKLYIKKCSRKLITFKKFKHIILLCNENK